MFEQLQHTPLLILEKAVSRVICEQMNPPTLSKIKESMVLVRNEYQIEDPNDSVRSTLALGKYNDCPHCYGMGLMNIRKKSEFLRYSYVRTCSCSAGAEAAKLPENKNKLLRWDSNPDLVSHHQRDYDLSVPEAMVKFKKPDEVHR